MSRFKAFLAAYPASLYFALTFAISWGGMLVVVGPAGFPVTRDQADVLLPAVVLALLAGPSVAGTLLTGVVRGMAGLRQTLARLLTWRLGARWYAAACLTAPVVTLALLLGLSLRSREFLPALVVADDPVSVLRFGMVVAIAAGVFEELGWTAFATPALRQRFGVVATGLLVGLPWAAWHVLPAWWLSGVVSGPLALLSYLLDPFLFLVGFRVLMVWVYDRTQSLLLAMLMHTSLTASARILGAPAIAGAPLLTFDLAWAAVVWAIVAAVVVADRLPRPGRSAAGAPVPAPRRGPA